MMGPQIAEHRGVVIRYGYDIVTDRYYAHANIPNVITSGVPSGMRENLKQHAPKLRYTLDAEDVEVLIDAMKEAINERLDD
jgi:hypothetical protein